MVQEIKALLSQYPEPVQWLARSVYGFLITLTNFPFSAGERLYWVYLVSFVLMATFAYVRYYHKDGGGLHLRALWRFWFPKEVYSHPSAVLDYKVFVTNNLIGAFLNLQGFLLLFYSQVMVAQAVTVALSSWIGEREPLPQTWWTMLACVVAITIAVDFGDYIDHVMEHYIPILWPIHMVHHSAEVLTPVTVYRMHPLTYTASLPIRVSLVGSMQGVLFYLFHGKPTLLTIGGVNVIVLLFNLVSVNLRHSHVWFPYPWALSHIFISPAQHQIHHSVAPQHLNKNFGSIFALWDWIFGTLYVPREREQLVFGLGVGVPQAHPSLAKFYFKPLSDIAMVCRSWWSSSTRTLAKRAGP